MKVVLSVESDTGKYVTVIEDKKRSFVPSPDQGCPNVPYLMDKYNMGSSVCKNQWYNIEK